MSEQTPEPNNGLPVEKSKKKPITSTTKSKSELKAEQAKRAARNEKERKRRAAAKATVECSICGARGPSESSVVHNDGCTNRPGETKYTTI